MAAGGKGTSDSAGTSPNRAQLNGVGVGAKYEKNFGKDGSKTPWLTDNQELQRRIRENQWIRWDGTEGTIEEHTEWVLGEVRSLTSFERSSEFRPYGVKNGCQYYIHDELTAAANGSGLFKIEGTFDDLQPKDVLAIVFDMEIVAKIDPTYALLKVLKTYHGKKKGDPYVSAVYWANDPGWPIYVRDGIDSTGYAKDEEDENGKTTVWQVSTSLTGSAGDSYFQSQPRAVHAKDRYFAYKLETQKDTPNTTKVTIICQTVLNGWLPNFLSNRFVCDVLIDYMTTLVKTIKTRKESGEHQKMLEQLQLTNI